MQYLQEKYEQDFVIPILYTQIPTEVALTDSFPTELRIRILDKGTVLFNYALKKQKGPLEINLSKCEIQKEGYLVNEAMLNALIYRCLPSTSSLVSFFPQQFSLHYSVLYEKEVPVVLNGSIHPTSGYRFFEPVRLSPSTVHVYGPVERLQTIDSIFTEPVLIDGVKKSAEKILQLIPPARVKLSDHEVKVIFHPEQFTEKLLKIPITCVSVPIGYRIRLFPSEIELTCSVSLKQYALLKESDIDIRIDYNDLIKQSNNEINIYLTQKPPWLTQYRFIPDKVEFLIEKLGLP